MADPIRTNAQDVPLTIFTVFEWPEVDETYRHMLLRLPGDYEARISNPDAQRLGWRLNRDAGGVLKEYVGEPGVQGVPGPGPSGAGGGGEDQAEVERRELAREIALAALQHLRGPGGGVTRDEHFALARVVEGMLP